MVYGIISLLVGTVSRVQGHSEASKEGAAGAV